ncbi:MAG: cytochrome c-type biogenesis protein CcmH [Chloroflexi bacterium]|jgi:cytochrome c-type biogenesis protein CcmH|nr:cytochrome c-type biogenesis protein CcmH [Chloroflexota bacterium]
MASRLSFVAVEQRALPASPVTAIFAALLLSLLFALSGCIKESDITLEQRAHQLAGELMCPVCNGQTIDGSSAQIAVDMRLKVRDLLDEGSTNAEVRDYFVLRYGQDILAAPERSGFSLLAWIVPVIIVLGGIGIALLSIKSMRKSGLEAQPVGGISAVANQKQNDLSDYLAQVDRHLSVGSGIKSDEPNESGDAPASEKAKS